MRSIRALAVTLALSTSVVASAVSTAAAGPTGAPAGRTMAMVATAYGPSLKDNYPYGPVDAFGRPLIAGDVAVDPRVIPLGTHLYVTGYNSPYLPAGGFYAVARDTGGAIKGDRIDIFINGNARQVSSFGIQRIEVTVLGAGHRGRSPAPSHTDPRGLAHTGQVGTLPSVSPSRQHAETPAGQNRASYREGRTHSRGEASHPGGRQHGARSRHCHDRRDPN